MGSLNNQFERVRHALDWDVMGEAQLDKKISILMGELNKISERFNNAGTVLQDIENRYTSVYNEMKGLVSELPATAGQLSDTGSDADTGTGDDAGTVIGPGGTITGGTGDVTGEDQGVSEISDDKGNEESNPNVQDDQKGTNDENQGKDKMQYVTTEYNMTLEAALDKQMQKSPKIQKNGKWVNASREEVLQYMDPSNYDEGVYKYQFLDLSALAGISEQEMNNYLAGKGILEGKQVFFWRQHRNITSAKFILPLMQRSKQATEKAFWRRVSK